MVDESRWQCPSGNHWRQVTVPGVSRHPGPSTRSKVGRGDARSLRFVAKLVPNDTKRFR